MMLRTMEGAGFNFLCFSNNDTAVKKWQHRIANFI